MALEAVIIGDKQKKAKKRGRTLRFELKLAPPTEEATNEFFYNELVEDAKKVPSIRHFRAWRSKRRAVDSGTPA